MSAGDFHVAIVGAGIAGLALAMGLQKKGLSFTLYEEAPEYSAVGAGIGFGPNGLRAMDLIEPAFRPRYEKICIGNKPPDAQHVFFEGLLLEDGLGQDRPWHGSSSWGHPDFNRKSVRAHQLVFTYCTFAQLHQAHRKALLDVMTRFIPTQSVRFDKRLTDIEQHPDKVILRFADGEVAHASVLAGADGIKSMVREHVLKPLYPSQVDPIYAGSYCYRGVIPMHEAEAILGDLTDVAKFYFGYNRSAVTYRISGGEEFNFLLCVASSAPWPLPNAVTETVSHEAMMADFAGPDVDSRFRTLLSKAKPIKWGFFHHPQTAAYYRDRVAILGDSAHASLPFQAAGAAQGVEDAVVLSSVLAAVVGSNTQRIPPPLTLVRKTLAAYDEVRRPRAQKQLEQAAEVGRMIMFQHEEVGDDMQKILARLQAGRFEWLWFHDVGVDVQKALSSMEEGTRF
ncbi:salicylate hydroxylase [Stagonosporopsis vannaccii]|nr:salicylate hydroxylase [Stagonosporopsis vannaccii]